MKCFSDGSDESPSLCRNVGPDRWPCNDGSSTIERALVCLFSIGGGYSAYFSRLSFSCVTGKLTVKMGPMNAIAGMSFV